MKNLKTKHLLIAIAIIIATSSCSKDFLETKNEGSITEVDYYKTEAQGYSALVAAYSAMRKNSGGFENNITMLNAASDDHNAGGAGPSDGLGIHRMADFSINSVTIPDSFFKVPFEGIYNANLVLEKVPAIAMDATKKQRFLAEAKALRAYYYFNLVSMFGNVPLLLKTYTTADISNIIQSPSAEVYAQIEKDLTEAIPVLPLNLAPEELGRFTKGAATALLGKAYLYDKKYPQAVTQLALVNGTPGSTSAFGYKLLDKFSDLWKVNNKFNTESILEIYHTNQSNAKWSNWGGPEALGNVVNVMVGPRGYSNIKGEDIPNGWSFNPVLPELYNLLKQDPKDVRFTATILDLNELVANGKIKPFTEGDGNTGYFLNKFIPRRADVSPSGQQELNYQQDTYAIRLADTYLMEAEALGGTGARAQALFDAVRKRAGLLPNVTVSIDAIINERRLELAGEGFRWLDLVRTGKAATALAKKGFTTGKNEVLPIPQLELKGTKLIQNPNYQ
jgi:starch-binding outer membrane protein, SusD/RagB family